MCVASSLVSKLIVSYNLQVSIFKTCPKQNLPQDSSSLKEIVGNSVKTDPLMMHSDFIAVHRSTSADASLSQQLCAM